MLCGGEGGDGGGCCVMRERGNERSVVWCCVMREGECCMVGREGMEEGVV